MKKVLCMALIAFGAAVLLSTSFSVNSSRAADGAKITIAYTGCVLGYMEPCG